MRSLTRLHRAALALFAAAFALLILLAPAQANAASRKIALVAADNPSPVADVQAKLVATGSFSQVDIIDVRFTTPTLAQLQSYDSLLVWSRFAFSDATTLGDNLADYVDGGGGVVVAAFGAVSGFSIGGRFASDDYYVLEPGGNSSGTELTLGTIYEPGSPLMAGVSSFDGGANSFHSTGSPNASAARVADWTDGSPLIMRRNIGNVRRVDLNFFPPSSDSESSPGGVSGLWKASTDGATIMANALQFAGPVTTCVAPPSSMVSWWKGEGNAKDELADNDGTFNGTYADAGEVGNAFSFDGSSQDVDLGNPPDLNISGPITVDAWINTNVLGTMQPIYSTTSSSNHLGDVQLRVNTDGSIGWIWRFHEDGNSQVLYLSTSSKITSASWHHVAGVYDGSQLHVYIDGVLDGASQSVIGYNSCSTAPIQIGANACGEHFSGLIDEVEVFSRALSADEVQSIYGAGSFGKCPFTCATPLNDLIAWWPGDDTATDIQLGHNGSLTGGAQFGKGKVGHAFSFNGSSASVAIPSSDDWDFGGGDFSFDFWSRSSAPTSGRMYALAFEPSTDANALRNLDFDFNDSGHGLWVYWNGGGGQPGDGTNIQVGNAGDYTDGQWHHFALSRQGSNLTLYIDAAIAGAATYNDPIDLSGGNANALGALVSPFVNSGAPSFFWSGSIDEVHVFHRGLTAKDVSAIYGTGPKGLCKTFRLYVSQEAVSRIEKFDGNGTDLGVFADSTAGLGGTTGIAFNAGGELFAVNHGTNAIQKFSADGHPSGFATAANNVPGAVAVDLSGRVYVPIAANNFVQRFDPSGNNLGHFADIGTGEGLVFDASGNLYVSTYTNGGIEKFAPDGTDLGGFASDSPTGLAVDAGGNLFAANVNNDTIVKIDSSGAATTFANSHLDHPVGLAFDSDGNLYVANANAGQIEKFTPDGAGSVFASAVSPRFIAVQLLSPTAAVVQFDTTSYTVNEADGQVTVTVVRNGDVTGSSTVDYTTNDGTATAPGDYTTNSGSLTFDPGVLTKTFDVPIIDNTKHQPDHTFTVALSNASGALIGGPSQSLVTIVDNDSAPVVQNTNDSGAGSLRQALSDALAGDEITFNVGSGAHTIALTSGELTVATDLTISGPTTNPLTVSGNNASRVFHVLAGATASVANLTIIGGTLIGANGSDCCGYDGESVMGGGVRNDGSLTLLNVTLSGNSVAGGHGGFGTNTGGHGGDGLGGAVFNTGALTLMNCTVSDNSAAGGAGGGSFSLPGQPGVGNGGAVYNNGSGGPAALTIINSTLNGNSATVGGGGVYNVSGTLTVFNSTISGNSSVGNGGGIWTQSSSAATLTNVTLTNNQADSSNLGATDVGGGLFMDSGNAGALLRNTIVAANYEGADTTNASDIDGANGTSATGSNNLIGTGGSGGLVDGTDGNQVGIAVADLGLGALENNGGPTQTQLLLPGSPAINNGADLTTLSIDAGENDTLLNVANASGIAIGMVLQIGSEQVLVISTDTNLNTVAVIRAVNSTLAAPHSSGVAVNAATDQRGVARKIGSAIDIGAVEANYAVAATTGAGQHATISNAFATQLQATVTESGNPMQDLNVTFTAPASGASGTFAGSDNSVGENTNASGVATAPVFTANGAAGTYDVTASLTDNVATGTFSLTNDKASQTIDFGALSNKTFGNPDFVVGATGGGSSNPVTFGASGKCTAGGPNGSTIHITGAGTCTVTAAQAGNSNYNAATPVPRSFNVAKAASITAITVSNATYDGNPHGATASTTGAGLSPQHPQVGYVGRKGTVYPSSNTPPTNAGDYTASAEFIDGNHTGSNDSKPYSIAKAGQAIIFAALADKTAGDSDFTVSATGGASGNPVTFSASGPCTSGGTNGSTIHLTGSGTCTVTASQAGSGNYAPAGPVPRSFVVKAAPTPTPTATPTATPTPSATATPSATPTATATPTASPTATPTPTPPSQPLNISTRLNVLQGENVLIGGFFITGSDPKKVIVRAIGPSLNVNGVPVNGRLQDTVLDVFDQATHEKIASNDNWKIDDDTGQSQQSTMEETTVPPTDDLESALVRILSPGAYTAIVSGKGDLTGIALVEVFDLDQAAHSEFANISTRGFVNGGDSVMIGGFILGGTDVGTHILVRGIGPSLSGAEVANALPDPRIEVHNKDGVLVATNDNWKVDDASGESQQSAIEATTVPPTNDAESALLLTLQPGAYTAVLGGSGAATGVALVEVYNLK